MNPLISSLAEVVREKLVLAAAEGASEVRLIFHGPPLELLEQVFAVLLGDAEVAALGVPVVLSVAELGPDQANPRIGESGRCDAAHLLDLRNSPAKPTYMALVPPGQHSIRSVTSTTDEFGIAASNNAGNVPIEDWWADDFVQMVVRRFLEARLPEAERDDARVLIERAVAAADTIDADRTQRRGAWRVLSRLYSSPAINPGLAPAAQVSLVCGVPPRGSGRLGQREQSGVLEKISEVLSDGFGPGIERLKEGRDEADHGLLDAFLAHLRACCDLAPAFERATPAFYAPTAGLNAPPAPEWWQALTVEKWGTLLAEDTVATGDIVVTCTNGLLPLGKGMPVIVEDRVELAFEVEGPASDGVQVTLERTPVGPAGKTIAVIPADGGSFVDDEVPTHRTPIRYVASAEGFKPGALKVVSLATWQPGVFIVCRTARKLTLPRKPSRKGRSGPEWEAGISLPGAGRYEIIVFAGPGVDVDPTVAGSAEGSERDAGPSQLPVRRVRDGQLQLEVETDGSYQLDIGFTRTNPDGSSTHQTCRVLLAVEDVPEQGCRSEFERLLRVNRRSIDPSEAKSVVQLDRGARASSLQDWMLSARAVRSSYMPVVLADDYADTWAEPTWGEGTGPVFSAGRFLHDPRPLPGEFQPPPAFLDARAAIAARVRGDGDQSGLMESAELGKWALNSGFRGEVERYLDSYLQWLASDPDTACWADVVMVTSLGRDRRTLSRVPDAVLLSPLHPLRLAWHVLAQQVLVEADYADLPCPAAAVLDPDCVPDLMTLSLRSPDGIEKIDFVAVENGTDYWSVLWNGGKLASLPARSRLAPFGPAFGVSVGGISAGFSAAQVGRALEDVSDLLAAKPVIGVAITSAGGMTDACNEGLIGWCTGRLGDPDPSSGRLSAGTRLVEIFDDRDALARPDDATIANLSEDTSNRVRWFEGQPEGVIPDIGILAQLDMAEPSIESVASRAPIGFGGLIRHRIRRQLPGAFLSESRQGMPSGPSGDVLADKVATCTARLEALGDGPAGMQFAPNVNAIRDMLDVRRTDFAAVSSSAIDPACFLGGWLEGVYLWDYDLPSYSHRAGDTNGYYLLSRVKDADREALGQALGRLPGCGAMDPQQVQDVLLEVARRGIPTIRGLAGDDSGATGDLGLFVAARLLQDRFRAANTQESLLPVVSVAGDDTILGIVVPVDPFRGYLSDLMRALRRERKDAPLSRPDLLAISARVSPGGVRVHLTPIEVKCRPGSTFPASEVGDALDQARNLSSLLAAMLPGEERPQAWTLAFQHLILSMVGFGMRVYSQHPDVIGRVDKWAEMHERIASAILGDERCVSIDPRGRLIVVDDSPRSVARDHDGDGFDEIVTIGRDDAAAIVAGDPAGLYDAVRAKVDDWGLVPDVAPRVSAAEPPVGPGMAVPEVAGPAEAEAAPDESPMFGSASEEASAPEVPTQGGGIVLAVGTTTDAFQNRELTLNISDTRLNQLNMGVVGDLGTGKTQLLKSLITQITSAATGNRGIRPRFLIFDYKRDYSSPDFVAATGARVVKPYRLPLNLFDTTGLGESTVPWLDRFRFFADVLDKIYSGIGPVQRDKLKRAVRMAYDGCLPGQQPTLYDVHAAYAELLDGKSDSPMAIIDDLVDMEVFAASATDTQPFDEFLDGVVVISLDALGQDDRSKNMLVAVMLNMFYENMLRTPKRPFVGTDPQLRAVDSYLLVDEADNIMRYEFDVLRKLLLQGREFGVGVILASQYLRHFKVNATDYREPLLSWFIHKVPNVTPAELQALGLTTGAAEMAERVKALKNHHCLYKSFDVGGEVVRGLPFFELMQRSGP